MPYRRQQVADVAASTLLLPRAGRLGRRLRGHQFIEHVVEVPNDQGLTLVHFSAQRERFLWDRGYLGVGVFRGYLVGVQGAFRT
jgi:hypothetical protein